ncbi:hypothetical protein NPS70_05605 [Streptomyces sp. C10-9-1]|uniref:hypothetical protein n=1 Tax=Streptomyces sp. C10-9-1 TaxID=1859285 RepID=UPI0021130746|nr:hypothetical protein [Streptomyces sp. C10-9-1]MCQ6552673.1 hypothetical protein [Streptomyces sp. C10-9-1]
MTAKHVLVLPGRDERRSERKRVARNPYGTGLLAGVSAVSLLAGCASEARGYSVPEEFCGFEVQEAALSPVLLDGESLADTSQAGAGYVAFCRIRIDGRIAVAVEVRESKEGGLHPEDWEPANFKDGATARIPSTEKALVGSDRALALTGCEDPYSALFFRFFFDPDHGVEAGQRVADVEAFVADFVPSVKRGVGCTA